MTPITGFRLLIINICLFILFQSTTAELRLKRIEFTGNRSIKNLAKYLSIQPGSFLDSTRLVSDQKIIQQKYADIGFFWTDVCYRIIRQKDGLNLRWEIKENSRAEIGTIQIIGNERISFSTLYDKLKYRTGIFTKQKLEENVKALLSTYLDSGFAFCQVQPQNFQISDFKLSYQLKIAEGPEVIIKDIRFAGSFVTKEAVLKKIMGYDKNGLYAQTRLNQAIRRLEKTNLIDVIRYKLNQVDEEYVLEIEISERKSNELQGAFAYQPKTKERPADYSGFGLLNFKNLLGTMRKVKGSWSKNAFRTNYGLGYIEPYLFGWRILLGTEIIHQTKDTAYALTRLDLFTEILIENILTLRFETGYELVAPGLASIDRAETYWAGSGISFDNRDNPDNPSRGIFTSLNNRIGRKTFKYLSAQFITKSYFDSEFILPIMKKSNLAFRLSARNVYSPDTVKDYDLFYLGGANSLRGYVEEAFSSTRLFWLNNELRWLFAKESRIFPFFDIGAFLNGSEYEIKLGYGLGLRVISKIGLFGIDYGLGFKENLLNGKIHLTLKSQF
ncbi:MAG: BamA/TamA family outer membrane protein [candidate division WOR-3 bacterium]|nr:BamA/TamA family outer membrane protein [candidate division WOR-3 bacterium]